MYVLKLFKQQNAMRSPWTDADFSLTKFHCIKFHVNISVIVCSDILTSAIQAVVDKLPVRIHDI
jgi:hypothetical protein